MSYFDDMEDIAYAPYAMGKRGGSSRKAAPPTERELVRASLSEREWAWVGTILDNRKKIAEKG